MINVGIVGCDNLRAAELVRLLINHPDVNLRWVWTTGADVGQRLDSVVPGIMGECDLVLEPVAPSPNGVDLIFLCGSRNQVVEVMSRLDLPDDLRIIDLSGCHNLDQGGEGPWIYGLSEMQRRVLVHDAQWVTMPGNVAMASLLALMPMARNLMLNSPLTLHAAIGLSMLSQQGLTPDGMTQAQWAQDQQREVALALSQCQSSFCQPVSLTLTRLAERRTLAVAARFKCGIDGEVVRQLYDQYYDDHNFVFMVDRPIVTADVENTNKCLIYIDKNEHTGELTVHAVMDALLKGSSGNAVHAMNLLFGLHERVGLCLKGTGC